MVAVGSNYTQIQLFAFFVDAVPTHDVGYLACPYMARCRFLFDGVDIWPRVGLLDSRQHLTPRVGLPLIRCVSLVVVGRVGTFPGPFAFLP